MMTPLLLVALLLWFSLGYRFAAVKHGSRCSVRNLVERYQAGKWQHANGILKHAVVAGVQLRSQKVVPLRRYLDDAFGNYSIKLKKYSVLSRSIIIVTPLLGLLGTVSGMIETFDAMNTMSLFSQTSGIAGGISQALITTQLGLGLAIPGLLISRFIDKRQQHIEIELAQLKDILCSSNILSNTSFSNKNGGS